MTNPTFLAVRDLKLADVVQLFHGPFGTATVTNVTDTEVHMERPYGMTADFSYTGGVIAYIGHETIKYSRDSHATLPVWHRKDLK
jgi:hypothetical protein